jgi:hypothetical protein
MKCAANGAQLYGALQPLAHIDRGTDTLNCVRMEPSYGAKKADETA